MTPLDTFVAVSAKLSPLDEYSGIEMVEAVRFEGGEGAHVWQVDGRSFLDRALSLEEFVGNLPVVGYGAEGGIDVVRDLMGDTDESSVIDACFLARCLFPTLHDHRLTTVAAFLEVTGETMPGLIGRVFEELVDVLTDKGLTVLQVMLHLTDGTGSAITRVLTEAANRLARGSGSRGRGQPPPAGVQGQGSTVGRGRADWQEVFGIEEEEPMGEAGTPGTIDTEAVREILAPGGSCSRHLPGYEVREPQVAMAIAVTEAFNEGTFLVVEAGTGTGKSVAYLVPAIVWAVQNRTRVIVSTNTKPLQDQLVTKDLPQLLSTLGVPFTYTLLKGRVNYICLNRWTAVLQRVGTSLSRGERIAALLLVVWAMETTTGDITEHRGFDASRHAGLWNKVCSDPAFCWGPRCRSGSHCFSASARRTAQRSQVVVVNHSLLFSDLASDHAILSGYRYVVFDEAHHLEKVATQYLGRETAFWHIRSALDYLHNVHHQGETGLLISLKTALTGQRRAFDAQILLLMQKVRNVSERGRICFEEAAATFSKRVRESPEGYIQKVRFRKDDNPLSEIPEVVDEFERALLDLKQGLTELHEWMQDLQDGTFPMQEELTAELLGQVAKWHGIAEDVRFLTSAEEEGYVYWGELPAKGEERRLNRLVAVPRDVSRHLKETLYPRLQTAIFTSATLAVRGKFSYLIRRLGLDLRKTETLALLSPFNYEEQAVICLPQFLPSPKTEVFVTMVGQAIGELILRVRRGTLVLFTSYGMLQRVYRMVKPQAASEKITLLGQGIDGERSHLLSTFREEPGSVLLGVDSFWEGIDLPGEALEMLIITRLPFAVPTEPIVEAHLEEVAKGGKDPFLHYSIPEAALRLRQGFGRLIRNRTDRGVVVVMDSRTTTTTFGRVFLDVLPAPKRTFRSLQELIDGINAWFEKH